MIHSRYVRLSLSFRTSLDGTELTIKPQVKHVPDWFPGAGFKRFAKIGRELFKVAVDGPLEFVKQSLKVGLLGIGTHIPIMTLTDHEAGGRNVSIAALCFDRVAELEDQGFDESVIRSVTATMYIGKANRRSHGRECSFRRFNSRGRYCEYLAQMALSKLIFG